MGNFKNAVESVAGVNNITVQRCDFTKPLDVIYGSDDIGLGTFTKLMEEKHSKPRWIVCEINADSEVPVVAECLNTVLDDNKVLMLWNG